MLGKTAGGLFWMFRYLERTENTSRLIETGQRIALTSLGASDHDWRSVMETAGVAGNFDAHNEELTKDAAINWMLRSKDNPSSVLSSVASARQNARMVRTALTHEVWEATNSTYMTAKEKLARRVSERDLPAVMNTIRQRTALVRGATHGTMLRNDIYDFARLGTFLERADNTARILDVKYYVLLPSVMAVGSSTDNIQWESILRAVSARGGFRMEYGNSYDPQMIAQFLILDRRMPRSLAFCIGKLHDNVSYLAENYMSEPVCLGMIAELRDRLCTRTIDEVFDEGLHEVIQRFLTDLYAIGRQIEIDFRFYE